MKFSYFSALSEFNSHHTANGGSWRQGFSSVASSSRPLTAPRAWAIAVSFARARGRMIMSAQVAVVLLIPLSAATAQEFSQSASYPNATRDPSHIWQDKWLKPFANRGKGADITEWTLKANGVTYVISQILSEDCSAQLCPTRVVKLSSGAAPAVLVDDMMHLGATFKLDHDFITDGEYRFRITK
jgi:hypothetical protein